MSDRAEELKQLAGAPVEHMLGALLAMWRELPDAAIANAIAALTDAHHERCPEPSFDALPKHPTPELLRGVLLTTIDASSHKLAMGQLEEIARWRRDPRVTEALLSVIERRPWRSGPSTKSWNLLLRVLLAQRDPRVSLPEPAVWAASFPTDRARREMKNAMRHAAREQEAVGAAPTLSEDEREALAALVPKRTIRDADALLVALYEDVSDDASRAVYADLLSAHADAGKRDRGEFITLQLKKSHGRLTKEERKRESALFGENKMRWLGELGDVMLALGLTYERGFPVTGALASGAGDAIQQVTGDRRWRTFRSLDVRGDQPGYTMFLSDPVFYGLSELTCVSPSALTGFYAKAKRALKRLAVTSQFSRIPDALLAAKGMPHLETFALTAFAGDRPDELPRFVQSPIGQQVSRFEVEHSEEARSTYPLWCPALMKTPYRSFLVTAPRGSRHAASFTYDGRRDGEKWSLDAIYRKKKKHVDRFGDLIETVNTVRPQLSSLTLRTPRYAPSDESIQQLRAALGDIPLTLK